MNFSKGSIILLVVICCFSCATYEPKQVEEPKLVLPEKQADDDQTVEITYYQMRQAIFYKKAYDVAKSWVKELEQAREQDQAFIEKQSRINNWLKVGCATGGSISIGLLVFAIVQGLLCGLQ